MTMILAVCVAVTFAVSIYLFLGRELKGVAMGVFLLGHAANLSIIAMSGSPITSSGKPKLPPVTSYDLEKQFEGGAVALQQVVDPLPQALILTAIVIGFAVMGFLLSLLVVTARATQTLEIDDLKDIGPDTDPAGGAA